tara:strand:- start:72 stop:278 length:207 start_codon:yes stop_codon:yes gene_type:complete
MSEHHRPSHEIRLPISKGAQRHERIAVFSAEQFDGWVERAGIVAVDGEEWSFGEDASPTRNEFLCEDA